MKILELFGLKAAREISPEERQSLGNRLIIAADSGDLEAVQQALKDGADVNFQDNIGRTALMIFAEDNQPAGVELLLSKEADVTLTNNSDQTALHLGARRAVDQAIWQGLLDAGAPVNLRDKHGATVAFYAAQTDSAGLLEALAAEKADFTMASKKGATPLMQATAFAHTAAIAVLVQRDCAIDAQDDDGRTALMHAALSGNLGFVRELLARGANFDLRDNNGETAEQIATRLPGRQNVQVPLAEAFAARIAPFRDGTERHITAMKKITLSPRNGAGT